MKWTTAIPAVSGAYWTRLASASGPAGTFLIRVVRHATRPECDCVEFFGTEDAAYLDEPEWFADREFFGPLEVPQ